MDPVRESVKAPAGGKLTVWLEAFRLRTLPLAAATILLGTLLAASEGALRWPVAVLCLLTAVLLQILTNLANDYGDTLHGADSPQRVGPRRVTQQGFISAKSMRLAILAFLLLAMGAGLLLIINESVFFYVAGLAAIGAAIGYTVGPRPYGYRGLGDLFVFLFFGLVGVGGTYYLQTHRFSPAVLLPAATCGFFCVAVLNINNMRDLHSDALAGKRTLPVRLGLERARVYHWALLGAGVVCALAYTVMRWQNPWQLLFLIALPPLWKNGRTVARREPHELDPYLKQMSITTLLFCLTFGLGLML